MSDALPGFEGATVTTAAVKITNAGDGLSEALEVEPKALHLGDEVSYVIRGTVAQVAHKTINGKVTRVQTVKATEVAELPENIAEGLIEQAAERISKLRDEKSGQTRIEDGPTHQVATDGTVLTPSDVADPHATDDPFGKFDKEALPKGEPSVAAETGGWGDAH